MQSRRNRNKKKFPKHNPDCSKVSFSLKEAKTIVNNNISQGRRRRGRDEQRYYYCPIHNAYHLTSKEHGRPKRTDKRWK